MDKIVLKAMQKWPNVPHVYGWLSLDTRGKWRLKDEVIQHNPTMEFINRNYASDDLGCWYFQNGPQRVYVTLQYTPWVYHWVDNSFTTHTGLSVGKVNSVYIDHEGMLLIDTNLGPGLIFSHDMVMLAEKMAVPNEPNASDDAISLRLQKLMAGERSELWLRIGDSEISIDYIHRQNVSERFKFNPDPQPIS